MIDGEKVWEMMRYAAKLDRIKFVHVFGCGHEFLLEHELSEVYKNYEDFLNNPHVGDIYENEKGERMIVTNVGNGDGLFYGVTADGKPISTFDNLWEKTGENNGFTEMGLRL